MDDATRPELPPPIEDDLEWDRWTASVDIKLKNLNLRVWATGGVAIAGLAIGFFTFKAVNNLMQGMQALGEAVNTLATPMASGMTPRAKVIDETPISEGPVGEPVNGPESGPSRLMQEDPIPAPKTDELRLGKLDIPEP